MVEQELLDFNQKLKGDVLTTFNGDENEFSKTEIFTNQCLDIISDSLNIDDVAVKEFMFSSKSDDKLDIHVSGFSITEDLESDVILNLFITRFEGNEVRFITKKEFTDDIKKLARFSNAAIKGHFQEVDEGVLGNDLKRLCDTLLKIRNKISRVKFYFLSNTIVKEKIKEDLPVYDSDDYSMNVEIIDLVRLNNINNLDGVKEPLIIDFPEETDYEIKCLHPEMAGYEDYECYLAVLPGELLADLYRKYHTRLLEANVRVFLQQGGKINRGIRNTITLEPKMFLAYNNGITATAEEVELSEQGDKIISVKNFQIVNGGQTVASLHYTLRNDKKKVVSLKDIYVQLKLTVIKNKERLNTVVSNISRYANSQNKVTDMDLSSNNAFFVELEKLSRSIYVSKPDSPNTFTHWYFERVRKQHKESLNKRKTTAQKNDFLRKFPKHQILVKSEVAKYMNVYNIQPSVVSKNIQNFNEYISKVIEDEFNSKMYVPSKIYYEDLIANTILYKETDSLYGSKRRGDNIGDTNLKAPVVVYTLSLFHDYTEQRLNLEEVFINQAVSGEILAFLKEIMLQVYQYFASQEGLASMIARNKSTFGSIKTEVKIGSIKRIESHLISVKEVKSRIKKHKAKSNDEEIGDAVFLKMTELGVRFWDGLLKKGMDYYPEYDEAKINSIFQKFRSKRKLTKSNLIDGNDILNKLEELNVSLEEVSSHSDIVQYTSEYMKDAAQLFRIMTEQQLKDLITIGRSGNQKKLSHKETDSIRKMFKDTKSGKLPDEKEVQKLFPKILELNRKFKIVKELQV